MLGGSTGHTDDMCMLEIEIDRGTPCNTNASGALVVVDAAVVAQAAIYARMASI